MSRRSLVTGAHFHLLKPRSSVIHRGRRTYVTTVVQYISGEFLDLAIALPYPLSWPPYASTIILTTVISRLVFTVPFSIWVRLVNFFLIRVNIKSVHLGETATMETGGTGIASIGPVQG